MSALDRVIACLLRNVDDVQRSMAQSEVVKSSVEDTQNTFESVGMEGRAAEAAAMADWVEEIQSQLLQIESQIQSQIPFAESLKTAGGGAAPEGNTTGSDAAPEPVATTGADPKPNPVHATPAHTREPSEKIGDPIKPVETEVPESNRPRRRRASREFIEGAEDLGAYGQELANSAEIFSDNFDPWGPEVRTETHTTPVMQQPQPAADLDSPDVVGTVAAMAAVVFEGVSRWKTRKKGDQSSD